MYETCEKVRQMRIKMGMTQEELAKELGVTKQYLSLVEKGVKKLNQKRMDDLNNIYAKANQDKKNKLVYVDYYPEDFISMEHGNIVYSSNKELVAISSMLLSQYSDFDKYSIVKCKTDGMSPTLKQNSYLILRHTNNEAIIDNEIYLFVFENKVFIRRLMKNINTLVINSDNKDIETIILQENEIKNISIIGIVCGFIN